MKWDGGPLGKYGQGIANPIEVNKRPKRLGLGYNNYNEKANVTASQEPSDGNKASSPFQKEENRRCNCGGVAFS